MADTQRDWFSEMLADSPEVPDDLRRDFEAQARALVHGRISGFGKVARITGAVIMGAVILCLMVWIVFGAFLIEESRGWPGEGWLQTLPFMVAFVAGWLLLAAGAFQCVYELRTGFTAPRRVRLVGVAIRYGSAFLIGIVVPVLVMAFMQRESDFNRFAILSTIITVFYWAVTLTLAFRRIASWYHENAILEQRRTQLAIALLREELARKPGV